MPLVYEIEMFNNLKMIAKLLAEIKERLEELNSNLKSLNEKLGK